MIIPHVLLKSVTSILQDILGFNLLYIIEELKNFFQNFRFQVKYTVTNTEDEECNVCLRWQPQHDDMMPGMHNLDAQSLVCLQPSVRIGLVKYISIANV